MNDPLTTLTRQAQNAYEAGNFSAAVSLQEQIIIEAARSNQSRVHHYLALGMFLFECGDFPRSLDWLQQAADLWPQNAEIAENTGVLLSRLARWKEAREQHERAIELGSTSLNVLDGLCHCHGQLKDLEAAQRYGRRVLEAKNHASLAAGTKHPLPSQAPPRFAPTQKQENVIAYSLWGDNPRYIVPLLENLRIAPHLFPAWTIRVYVDKSVPNGVLKQLRDGGAKLIEKSNEPEAPYYFRLFWRFEVANDSTVRRFLTRDADSLLTVKERVAIDAWLASDTYFHLMRDFYTHTDLMLAGMWGGVANILPNIRKLWRAYKSTKMQGRTADQRFLGDMVWPTVSQSCMIHDSVFTGCLKSIPFPPYGTLAPDHHIGQNAFLHFRQTRP